MQRNHEAEAEDRVANVFGIPITARPGQEVMDAIGKNIASSRERKYISITSGELMYNARRIGFIPDYIRGARFSLCDSMSVVLSGLAHGTRIRRFTGPALMERCAEYGSTRGWRHFFYGGADGVADLLSQKMSARFPGFQTAGIFCPPFRELSLDEENEIVRQINESRADILWVGLGVVKQEHWILRFRDRLNVPWAVGVGGAFDYHAGTVRRAPRWLCRIGLEWSYRLFKEPWRFKRISSAWVFCFESVLDAIFGRAPVFGGRQEGGVQAPAWRGKSRVNESNE